MVLAERQAELLILRASGLSYDELATALALNPGFRGDADRTGAAGVPKGVREALWNTMKWTLAGGWTNGCPSLESSEDWQPDRLPHWRECAVRGAPAAAVVGYASEVLQKRSDINQVRENWVMMFRRPKKGSSLAGERRNKHDPEEG